MYYFLSVWHLRNQLSSNVLFVTWRWSQLATPVYSSGWWTSLWQFPLMGKYRDGSLWRRCQNSQEKNIFGNWLSLVHQTRCSWLPDSDYLYLDFHLCSMTKLKGHSREICWPRWEYELWWRCKNKSERITWIWPDGLTRVKCVVSCCV